MALVAGNDVVSDARVLRYIAGLESLGHEVVAVGVSRRGSSSEFTVGRSRVIVEGTTATFRERLGSKWRQVRVVLHFGFRDADEARAARGQVARWHATAATKRGWRRAVLSAISGGGRAWLWAFGARRRPGRDAADEGVNVRDREAQVAHYLAKPGRAPWSTVLPILVRDAARIGPVLDALEPDVVHVQDVFMLGVGAQAVERARRAGRSARLVYDAHEYVRGLAYIPARMVAAYTNLEREFIGRADRVVTVSEPLADLLERDYKLTRRPTVVLNAPMMEEPPPGFRKVREVTGVSAEVPLLVYGGGVNTARGVDTAVWALAELPEAHLVVVTNRVNFVVRSLLELADDLGVADRVHLADYVEPRFVTRYFSDATMGLSTLLRSANHDVAVTNKFCEYLQAGMPIVTSDTPAQARLVSELGLGAVYPAGDAAGLAAAVRSVLADERTLRMRIADDSELRYRFSWPAQVEVLRSFYSELADATDPDEAGRDR